MDYTYLLGKHRKLGKLMPAGMTRSDDRRTSKRHTSVHFTTVIPLDERLVQSDERIRVIVEDISKGGVGFACPEQISTKYLVVNLRAWNAVQDCIIQVMNSRPFGSENQRYGCRFLERAPLRAHLSNGVNTKTQTTDYGFEGPISRKPVVPSNIYPASSNQVDSLPPRR